MAYITGNRAITPTLGARAAEVFSNTAEAYRNWRTYRVTLNELRALSSRELADLGISHSMVRRLALESAYGSNV